MLIINSYLRVSSEPKKAVDSLKQCLEEAMGWMKAKKLKLNHNKTVVLLVGSD